MNAVSTELLEAVRAVVAKGPLAKSVRDLEIEPGCDSDDDEFLRIKLFLVMPKGNIDAQLEALLENIEEAVGSLDSRYASIRFLDAA